MIRYGYGPLITWEDCGMRNDEDVSCPVCGATIEGKDAVDGVCQIGGFIGRPIMDYVTRHQVTSKES